jgi:SAM-dependent methyltransferase
MLHLSTAPGDHVILRLISMAVSSGYLLERGNKILDLGCGSGADVYRFRDLDFDAYGFDIHDYLALRSGKDRRYFSILSAKSADSADFRVDWKGFSFPYEDESFDLVFSSQVLEHVQDHNRVLGEVARVMKPGSVSFHIFPPRYVFKEPHFHVPFGSWINRRGYYLFWALMGVRNQYQAGMTAREVADQNYRYAKNGLNYLKPREVLAVSRRHFASAEFVPQLWEQGTKFGGRMTNAWYHTYYTFTKNSVLRLENPIKQGEAD